MTRRTLPSLDRLIFFESVARNLSFSAAAKELNVSQAAVSKRIATLEEQLGYRLFDRSSRRTSLTPEAMMLFERTKAALDYLSDAFSGVNTHVEDPTRVGTNSATFSVFWLQDRLAEFTMSDESAAVTLVATDDFDEVIASKPDVAVFYGSGRVPNWKTFKLSDEVLVPVASPDVADRYRKIVRYGIDDPNLGPPLLTFPHLGPSWVTWEAWLQRTGHDQLSRLNRIPCKTYSKTIGAAMKGQGVALGSLSMISDRIAAGKLERLDGSELRTGNGFYLAYRSDRGLSENGQCVFDFLLEAGHQVALSIGEIEMSDTAELGDPVEMAAASGI